ncbi:hypothetical protein NXY19_00005 (plasmid) [Bacteroides fragilis]|nr:hypothetical protein [Bacteroides fragilis]
MNRIIHISLLISTVSLFLISNTGCVEKQGYYNHGEESIISLICDITWAGKKTTDENGSVWQGTYKFNKNGTYTRTNIEIDKQGNKKEANHHEILMWLSFGIRPAKNEHKRLLILKIQSPLVTAFGLSFFLSPKVGNSFQTAKHHSKNLHITSQKAFTTKLSSLSSMEARPHSPGCAILTQIHY